MATVRRRGVGEPTLRTDRRQRNFSSETRPALPRLREARDAAAESASLTPSQRGYAFSRTAARVALDHVWFFHERVLEAWSKRPGLETVGVTRLRPFHLQDNIYFIARKPAR